IVDCINRAPDLEYGYLLRRVFEDDRLLLKLFKGCGFDPGQRCFLQGLLTLCAALISEFLEVIVVDSKEVGDFVNQRGFQLVFELFDGLTLILEGSLENYNPIRIQRLLEETAFRHRDTFVQTEQGILVRDAQMFLQLLGWIVLHNDRDVLEPVAKLWRQFANSLADQTFKRFLIHKACYRGQKICESIIGRTGPGRSERTTAAVVLRRGSVEEAIYLSDGCSSARSRTYFCLCFCVFSFT